MTSPAAEQVQEVSGVKGKKRIRAPSDVHDLGPDLSKPQKQKRPRKTAGAILKKVRNGKIAGRTVLQAGQLSTGKIKNTAVSKSGQKPSNSDPHQNRVLDSTPPQKKPRCARKARYSDDSVPSSADSRTPSPPAEQLRPNSLSDELEAIRIAKAQVAKYIAKLNSDQRKLLAKKQEENQVGHFMMPDSPQKGKGKKSAPRSWISCPLLPDTPAVPPPRKPQKWKTRPHGKSETIAETTVALESADTCVPDSIMETSEARSDNDSGVIEGTAPTVTETMSVSDPPFNPVWTDIELIGFASTSSSSKTAPESGVSGVSHGIDNVTEGNLANRGDPSSDVEEDNDVDVPLRARDIFQYQMEELDDPTLPEAIEEIDAEADIGLRAMADPEDDNLLKFDWCGDIHNFQGVREEFTGPSGPTFPVKDLKPLQIFKMIWDDDIIDLIVNETNRYAGQMQLVVTSSSRISRWKDTTREEIWQFFTVMMLQSIVVTNVEREYWYPSNEQLRIGSFGDLMPYNRFVLLKRCLHFVNNASLPENYSKLEKILPVIKHLNNKFSALYLPEQNVAVDESLLLWEDRLSYSQMIKTKKAKVGIKSYELCESRTGYLWRMKMYSGKRKHKQGDELESATSQIIFNLMRPLFGRGQTIVMDNFYNAPLLSRLLKRYHRTDTMGTLRLNREFAPQALQNKNKENMKVGEVSFRTTKDLCVVVWNENKVVSLISTFHKPKVEGKEKYGYYKYRPKVVLDYNLSMGGLDNKDQMLHSFPIERARNVSWYNKLFRRLINVSILNARVIYNHERSRKDQLDNRTFRLQLVQEMMEMYCPRSLKEQSSRLLKEQSSPPASMSQWHFPAKNKKKQRCKLCYRAKVWRTTIWRCSTCNVNLCIVGCYADYHAEYVCE